MGIKSYHKATSLEEAYKLLKENSKNQIIAGGLWIKKIDGNIDTVIDLEKLGLNKIERDGDYIKVGAMVTQREFEQNELIKGIGENVLSFATSEVMSATFRNMATIGASVVAKYPFSDIISALLLIKTVLVFYPNREVSLEEYLKEKVRNTEILTHILIKDCKCKSYFYKVKMTQLDFPILNIGVSRCPNKCKYKIVVGSRPSVASLCHEAMEYINNIEKPTEEDFSKAALIVREQMKFLTTIDASEEYRELLAKAYVKRGLMEVSK